MNPIQKLIQTNINNLIESSKGFDAVQHSATKGDLRETILKDFFRLLIPNRLSITSGIICDAKGRNSKQTDLIVYNKEILPNVLLSSDKSMVPVETVYLIAEIKSTLRASDLTQVKEARNMFNQLQFADFESGKKEGIKIPSVILAFKNEVAQSTLKDWLNDATDVVSICIIGEYTISKVGSGIEFFENDESLPENWETLNFCIQIYNYLNTSIAADRGNPLWAAYLQGADKFMEINNIKTC